MPALGLGLFVGHAMAKGISWLDRIIPSHGGVAELIKPVWPLSLACACVYLTVALFVLLREAPALLGLRTYLRLVLRWRTYLMVAVLAGLVLLMRPLARGGPGPFTPVDLLRLISWLSVTAPLKSLVAHAVFFGPVVLVLILGWRAVARSIGAAGPGIVLVAALAITLSLDSESRHLVIFVPFLVSFAAKAVDAEPPSRRNLGIFAVLSLLVSKVWLVFGDDSTLYLSNIGPWMSHDWYVVDGLVLLVLGGWCARSGVVPRGSPVVRASSAGGSG